MSAKTEMARLRREAAREGWLVTPTGRGHWKFSREGCKAVFASNTPRTFGGVQQCKRDLAKAREGRLK